MKYLLLLAFVMNFALAQNSIHIDGIDLSNLPKVTAQVFPFTNSELTPDNSLSNNDFKIEDQFSSLPVINYTTLEQNPDLDINVTIYIDLNIINETTKSEIKRLFVALEDLNVAWEVVGHDRLNYVYKSNRRDYTEGLIERFEFEEFTDFNRSLDVSTSNPILNRFGSGESRSIIWLTNSKMPAINFQQIQNNLNSEQLRVFIINHNQNESLKSLAKQSGGDFYNGSLSKYIPLLISKIFNYSPSLLEWEISASCFSEYSTTVSLDFFNTNDVIEISVPDSLKLRFQTEDFNLEYSRVLPGKVEKDQIFIEAQNGDITIYSLKLENDYGGVFSINGEINEETGPQTILKGNSYGIALEYAPVDSALAFTRILIESDACQGEVINILGGFPNVEPNIPTLKLIKPECGEDLVVGDQYLIEWEGLLPEDIVQLEMSTDDGQSWEPFASNVNGLEYRWEIPDMPTDNLLVRVVQFWPNNIGETEDLNHNVFLESNEITNFVKCSQFDPSADYIVTGSFDGVVRIWSTIDASLISEFEGHNAPVTWVGYSPDGKLVISSDEEGVMLIHNADTEDPDFGKLIVSEQFYERRLNKFDCSKTRPEVILVYSRGNYVIYDYQQKELIVDESISGESNLRSCKYSLDGDNYFLGGNKSMIYQVDRNTHQEIKSIVYNDELSIAWLNHIDISPDNKLISVSENLNGTNRVFDIESGEFKYELKHINELSITSSFFFYNSTDSLLFTSGGDYLTSWNANTGDNVEVFREHTSNVNYGHFNFDGSLLVTSSDDGLAKIWKLNEYDLQNSVVDCPLKIINANFTARDVSFNSTQVNTTISNTFTDFLRNTSNGKVRIKSISIEGADKEAFQLQNDFSDYLFQADEVIDLGIDFIPNKFGEHNAFIEIELPASELRFNINGFGDSESIQNLVEVINVGTAELGDFIDSDNIEIFVNNSGSNIQIDSFAIVYPDVEVFGITNWDESANFTNGSSRQLSSRFTALSEEDFNAAFKIWHNGNYGSSKVLLQANGIPFRKDTITLMIDNFEANSGDFVNVPINYEFISELGLREELQFFDITLSFNSSVLIPTFQAESDEIIDGLRFINVLVPISTDSRSGDLLTSLQFQATLGNDSVSVVNVESIFEIPSFSDSLTLYSPRFRLLDLCYEGGARFVDASGVFEITSISPNPTGNQFQVNLSLIEDTPTKLYLVNAIGDYKENLYQDEIIAGKYEMQFDLKGLAPGNYFLILETNSLRSVKTLIIEK